MYTGTQKMRTYLLKKAQTHSYGNKHGLLLINAKRGINSNQSQPFLSPGNKEWIFYKNKPEKKTYYNKRSKNIYKYKWPRPLQYKGIQPNAQPA